MPKLLGWALVAFGVFYVMTDPAGAASGAHHAINGLGHIARGIAAFITSFSHT